jgi:hypothetical protein
MESIGPKENEHALVPYFINKPTYN